MLVYYDINSYRDTFPSVCRVSLDSMHRRGTPCLLYYWTFDSSQMTHHYHNEKSITTNVINRTRG